MLDSHQSIYLVPKSSVCHEITPCRAMSVDIRFGGSCRLHLQCGGALFAMCLTLNIKAKFSSEVSVDFQQAAQCYVQKIVLFMIITVRTLGPSYEIYLIGFCVVAWCMEAAD
jgi:hypothetical protein